MNTPKRPVKITVAIAAAAAWIFLLVMLFVQTEENRALKQLNAELRKEASQREELAMEDKGRGVNANGFLKVQEGRLVNQAGWPLQLKGMSSHGLIWYPQYINFKAMLDLKARGANLFRAAMYADSQHEGYNENDITRRTNKALLYLAVENALAADLYAIVDWHVLKDENPLLTVDSAIEFFDEVSRRYAEEPGVIYEICNEPNGAVTWRDVHQYARQVIPVIRRNAPRSVIVVGTPSFSADVLSVLEAPLDFPGIMYSYHQYTGTGQTYYREILETMRREGLGIFVTEWGIDLDEKTGLPALEEAREFLAYLKEQKISWANWSLSNKDEPYSAIKPEVWKLSNWQDEDLTPSGRLVFEALAE